MSRSIVTRSLQSVSCLQTAQVQGTLFHIYNGSSSWKSAWHLVVAQLARMGLGTRFPILLCQKKKKIDSNSSGDPFAWRRKRSEQNLFRDVSSDGMSQTVLRCPGKSLRKHSVESGLSNGSPRKATNILQLRLYRVLHIRTPGTWEGRTTSVLLIVYSLHSWAYWYFR